MAWGLAVLGSQLPDIDTTTSTIGKIFFPLSSFLEDRFPHRSITHSLLATGLIAAVSLPIGYFLGNWLTAIALPLGHLLACFSDCFTKQGVQLFFLPVGIASLTALALAADAAKQTALPNLKAESPQPQPAVAQSGIAQQDAHREADLFEIASPRRLTVTVKVSEPQELKVQEGSVVKKR